MGYRSGLRKPSKTAASINSSLIAPLHSRPLRAALVGGHEKLPSDGHESASDTGAPAIQLFAAEGPDVLNDNEVEAGRVVKGCLHLS